MTADTLLLAPALDGQASGGNGQGAAGSPDTPPGTGSTQFIPGSPWDMSGAGGPGAGGGPGGDYAQGLERGGIRPPGTERGGLPGLPSGKAPVGAPPLVQDSATIADQRLAGLWSKPGLSQGQGGNWAGAWPTRQNGSMAWDDLRNPRLPLPAQRGAGFTEFLYWLTTGELPSPKDAAGLLSGGGGGGAGSGETITHLGTGQTFQVSGAHGISTASTPSVATATDSHSAAAADREHLENIAAASGARPSDFAEGGDNLARQAGAAAGRAVYGGLGARYGGLWGGVLGSALGDWVGGTILDSADTLSGGAVSGWLGGNPGVVTGAEVASWLPIGGSAAGKVAQLTGKFSRTGATVRRTIGQFARRSSTRRGVPAGRPGNIRNVSGGGNTGGGGDGRPGGGDDIPTLRIDRRLYPELAENIEHAQRAGRPSILTNGGNIGKNREDALRGIPKLPGTSRDEYPFASSIEGRQGAWVGHIPILQHNAQGGLIRQFLRKYNLKHGDKYRVEIVP